MLGARGTEVAPRGRNLARSGNRVKTVASEGWNYEVLRETDLRNSQGSKFVEMGVDTETAFMYKYDQ